MPVSQNNMSRVVPIAPTAVACPTFGFATTKIDVAPISALILETMYSKAQTTYHHLLKYQRRDWRNINLSRSKADCRAGNGSRSDRYHPRHVFLRNMHALMGLSNLSISPYINSEAVWGQRSEFLGPLLGASDRIFWDPYLGPTIGICGTISWCQRSEFLGPLFWCRDRDFWDPYLGPAIGIVEFAI